MSTKSTYKFTVAVALPAKPGSAPKSRSRVYEIDSEHDDPDVRVGLASIEAIRRATEEVGEWGDYPYVAKVEEIGTNARWKRS